MGRDARRMTRWSTTIVLVGAVSSVAAGVAFADAAGGVSVPDSTFRQGTGTREIDISIARPMVGSAEALVIWPLYNSRHSNSRWMLGVIADRSTGARCGYDAGQWECAPGRSGWHPGDVRVQVGTADAMDCGLAPGVCDKDEIEVQAIPYGPNPRGGLPGGPPISVSGSVVIMPNLLNGPSATPTGSAPVHHPSATSSNGSAPQTSSANTVHAASTSASPAPTAPSSAASSAVALVPATGPSAESIDAENTSSTATQGSDLGLYAALLIPIALGVAAPFGYQAGRRRRNRRRSGASAD